MNNAASSKIIFWTEGGGRIGLGHLCRCLILAKTFSNLGHQTGFIVNDDSAVIHRLKVQGFPFRIGKLDDHEVPAFLENARTTFIFDSKRDISAVLKNLKTSGHKTILLDNTTPARLAANVVIYPSAVFNDELTWSGFSGRVYSGAQYAPVDEACRRARKKCEMLEHRPPYRILVTMGGSDPMQVTNKIVGALRSISMPIEIKVVIGPSFLPNPRLATMEHENTKGLTFIKGQNSLFPLMADAHMAITAVGTTLYELAAVGVPGIVIANYREDQKDMQGYKGLGMNRPLGFYQDITALDIQEAVLRFIQDAAAWQDMRNAGWRLIDGHGAGRIAECILASG